MRNALIFLCCWRLAAADTALLRELADKSRVFELRRALQQKAPNDPETLFYRALVTSRFGHETDGLTLLAQVLSTNPEPDMKKKVDVEKAAACERLGRYGEAARAWREALELTSADDHERGEMENTRILMDSLSEVAPTSAEFGTEASLSAMHNRLGSWDVPVEMNGAKGQWILDTGANLSTLTESEAKRMGLLIREAKAYVNGSTGKKNALRLAVANELRFGRALVRNVVFLVLADEALHIGALRYQITGILGMPVLRALRRMNFSEKGEIQINAPRAISAGTPNLFFDELTPIMEIRHNKQSLQMFIDSGANTTTLYPSFGSALTGEERSGLRKKREKTAGAGGMLKRRTAMLPALRIEILGTPVDLKQLSLLPEMPTGNSRFRDGVIGMDALRTGFLLDFEAMEVRVR